MRNVVLLALLLSPSLALADDGSFLDWIGSRFDSLHYAITEEVPGIFHRLVAWGVEFYTLCVITAKLQAIEFAFLVAKQIATDINISGYLLSSISQLPSGVRWMLELMGFANIINLIVNAYITRFVLNVLGW
ncbi:DUF2523 domain-containing protein [Aeromonas hydrophila]|nr:DUF2523 domain-containing protein [Aeromonas hydrophila]